MSEKILKRIEQKLDTVVGLLASTIAEGERFKGKTQGEKILALTRIGLEREMIAGVLDTTPETVRVALWKSKKKAGAEKTSKKRSNDGNSQ